MLLLRTALLLLIAAWLPLSPLDRSTDSVAHEPAGCRIDVKCIVIDDFQAYEPDGLPLRWSTYQRQGEVYPVSGRFMNNRERFIVKEEDGNKFVRAIIRDEAHRLIMPNDGNLNWKLDEFPVLSWDWRANVLPIGGAENKRGTDDTGAAVYVVFGKDWLGRPKSIKYSYSSTLPVGTTISSRTLKVLVVASGATDGTGRWLMQERNLVEDYRQLFGGDPPNEPKAIMLWSDADTNDSLAEADFDNVTLVSPTPDVLGAK
jgi:hypothetical protein